MDLLDSPDHCHSSDTGLSGRPRSRLDRAGGSGRRVSRSDSADREIDFIMPRLAGEEMPHGIRRSGDLCAADVVEDRFALQIISIGNLPPRPQDSCIDLGKDGLSAGAAG